MSQQLTDENIVEELVTEDHLKEIATQLAAAIPSEGVEELIGGLRPPTGLIHKMAANITTHNNVLFTTIVLERVVRLGIRFNNIILSGSVHALNVNSARGRLGTLYYRNIKDLQGNCNITGNVTENVILLDFTVGGTSIAKYLASVPNVGPDTGVGILAGEGTWKLQINPRLGV